MNRVIPIIVGLVVFSTVGSYGQSESGFPNLSGPYLGQEPPGKEFQPFATCLALSGILNTITFSPDGDEAYWATRNGIKVSRLVEGRWTKPEFVSFSGTGTRPFYDDAPVISPHNKRLYFTSRRPISYSTPNQYHIWYVERTSSGWSEPQPLPEIVNSTPGLDHWQLSISNSGTLYFNVFKENGYVIHFSNLRDGEYTVPEQIDAFSSFGMVKNPFIAPDESYIIFNKMVNLDGEVDGYYISLKGQDDTWLPPLKMFKLENRETAFVTRDGKYIICIDLWASAEIIEELRPKR